MSGFDADWLALRRAADARARDGALLQRLAVHLSGREELTILDLGAGTGANMALTAPHLPAPQRWRLVDDDPALLARAAPPAGATAEAVTADLSAGLAPLLAPPPDLVTAQALIDLAGAAWLDALADAVAGAGLPLYVTLSYDGRQCWEPAQPLDARVHAAFDADQRRDKGLGPALGPDAHGRLAARLAARGHTVHEAASDWQLEAPGDAALIAALADATAAAARPALGREAGAWAAARRSARAVTIGHRDLLALPPG